MPSCLLSTIEDIYDSTERFTIAKQFLDEKHPLIESKFVEFNQKGNMFEAQVKLTEEGKKFFLDEDYELYACRIDESKLKKPEDIRAKKLFYSEQNQKQIDELTKSLSQTSYNRIKKSLKSKGLPCGIAVMLYGEPGCGKTESVYQLAKKTGRAIMHVDISQTKSCWVGESEKNVKKIFTDYKALCEQTAKQKNGRIPILFFNECDAVLSKRREIGHSNTAQMENAIQNILLEEIEKLDGILIATTNLVDNLDSAFERRFLFKIQFEKPSVEAKKAIWKNKIPWLTQDKASKLAASYNFSGGEIDNIVRKAQMKEIISGSRPAYNDIVEMCQVEKLHTATVERRVGFV
jgi:SpoVK/Ycf46/Vps4 family AAA+-type ATPase